MADNTIKMQKVWDISKQLELIKGEDITNCTGSADISGIELSTTHRTGKYSISFDKSGTAAAAAVLTFSLAAKNCNIFALHKLKYFVSLSALTNIANVGLRIGTSASHHNLYTTADTALSTGWNEIDINCDSPSSVVGNGVDWYNVTYVALVVTFDNAANTLTDILLDSIAFYKLSEAGGSVPGADVNITQLGGNAITTGAGAVAAGTQRVTHASDDPVTTSVQIMDDWDESDRAKVNLIVGQAGISAGSAAVGATTPSMTLATNDPAVTALQIMDDWDESDRAKVNLIVGQAGISAGSAAIGVTTPSVTLATNDPAVASLAIMDDWDNAASDGASVSGDVAHDSPDAGEPIKLGGKASTAIPTAVADADRVNAYFDEYGRLATLPINYDLSTVSCITNETNSLDEKYLNESYVDTTNVAAATNYYSASTGAIMDGWRDLSLSGKFIDADGTVTLTLEVMNDEDTASGDWIQVYFRDDKNNVNVNSITVTNGTVTFAISAPNNSFRYYRWVVVTSGATNTIILKNRKKAL